MTKKTITLPFLIKACTPTVNGHIYPREVLQAAIDGWQERIEEGRTWGELGSTGERVRLERVSHRIVDLRLEGDDVVATALILDTKQGNILAALEKGKVDLKFNPVGHGNVDPETGVISNYKLDSINIEAKPSEKP